MKLLEVWKPIARRLRQRMAKRQHKQQWTTVMVLTKHQMMKSKKGRLVWAEIIRMKASYPCRTTDCAGPALAKFSLKIEITRNPRRLPSRRYYAAYECPHCRKIRWEPR